MKRSTKDGPWAWINHNALLSVAALGGERVAVYVALCYFESRDVKKGQAFSASLEQLGNVAGVSLATVKRALTDLVQHGLISMHSGRDLGSFQSCNKYTLLDPKWLTQSHSNSSDRATRPAHTEPSNSSHRAVLNGSHRATLKKERNIEPGASSPRDSIKKETAENVVAFPAPNSAAEEELSEGMKEIMRVEAEDRRRAAEKLAAGPRALKSLEDAGLIKRYSGCNACDQNTRNRYVITWNAEGLCEPEVRTLCPDVRTPCPDVRTQSPSRADGHSVRRLKERRTIEPTASSRSDSIEGEEEDSAENVVALTATNSADEGEDEEEELSEGMKEIMRVEAEDRRRAAEKLAAGPSPEELERRRKFLESRVL